MIFYKMWIYFQIVSLRPYDVLDDRMINFIWSLLSKWILYNCLRVLKYLQKYFETKTDLSEAQKTTISRLSKPIVGALFFKNDKFYIFLQ